MNRAWLGVYSMVLAGAVLFALFFTDRLPAWLWPSIDPVQKPSGDAHCNCGPKKSSAPASAPSVLPKAPPSATRFAVCPREETPAALFRLQLSTEGPDVLAIHCGPSVHLIAVEHADGHFIARRMALLSVPSHEPALAPRSAPIAMADLDGDGLSDLLVSTLLVDSAGTPSGGALYVLHRQAQGGFAAPKRLLDLAPAALVVIDLDKKPGDDLALLHLVDSRTAKESELWLVHGGVTPLRTSTLPAGKGATALASADLDRDGQDDLTAIGEGRARVWLRQPAADEWREPLFFTVPGAREVLAGDINADGHRDLIFVGDRIWTLLSPERGEPGLSALPDSEGVRAAQLWDVEVHGRVQLLGYAHPNWVTWENRPAGMARATLFTVAGELSVLFAQPIGLKPGLGLALLLVSAEAGGQLELVLAAGFQDGSPILPAQRAETLRDLPLAMRVALP